jgi:hypothetical protein
MKISYECSYTEGVKPSLDKVISSSTEKINTVLTVENLEELEKVESTTIYEHMENLHKYLQYLVSQTELVGIGVYPDEGLPVLGWVGVVRLNEEINRWWTYIFFKNEPVQVLPQ